MPRKKKSASKAPKKSTKKPAKRSTRVAAAPEIEEALAVFGRAEEIYPKLLAQRSQVHAELQRVDAALARLAHVAGVKRGPGRPKGSVAKPKAAPAAAAPTAEAAAPAAEPAKTKKRGKAAKKAAKAPKAEAPAKPGKKKKAKGAGKTRAPRKSAPSGAPTVAGAILAMLEKSGPMTWTQVIDGVAALRPDVRKDSVHTLLNRLRRTGKVKTTGARGDYKYSAG